MVKFPLNERGAVTTKASDTAPIYKIYVDLAICYPIAKLNAKECPPFSLVNYVQKDMIIQYLDSRILNDLTDVSGQMLVSSEFRAFPRVAKNGKGIEFTNRLITRVGVADDYAKKGFIYQITAYFGKAGAGIELDLYKKNIDYSQVYDYLKSIYL